MFRIYVAMRCKTIGARGRLTSLIQLVFERRHLQLQRVSELRQLARVLLLILGKLQQCGVAPRLRTGPLQGGQLLRRELVRQP